MVVMIRTQTPITRLQRGPCMLAAQAHMPLQLPQLLHTQDEIERCRLNVIARDLMCLLETKVLVRSCVGHVVAALPLNLLELR